MKRSILLLLAAASCLPARDAATVAGLTTGAPLYVALQPLDPAAPDAVRLVVSAPPGTQALTACAAVTDAACAQGALAVHAAGSRGERPLFALDAPAAVASGTRFLFKATDAAGQTLGVLAAYADQPGGVPTVLPDPALTPGELCTEASPDFTERRYAEQIPYCGRNVSQAEKDAVGRAYGIDPKDFHLYEFDHFLPLAAGGANTARNLWPQPLGEAHVKDQLENAIFHGMQAGTMTQAEAVAKIHAWRLTAPVTPVAASTAAPDATVNGSLTD